MNNKPKLKVYNAIQKSMIAFGINPITKTKVYYKWEIENRTTPLQLPFILVDYEPAKREWYIYYKNDKKMI